MHPAGSRHAHNIMAGANTTTLQRVLSQHRGYVCFSQLVAENKMQSDLCKRRWGQVAQSGSFPALHLKPASVSGCLQSAHRFFFSSQLSVLIPASFRKLRAMDSCICRQQHQVSSRDCSVNTRLELPDHVRPCFREVWGHKPRSMANYTLYIRAP